MEDETLTEPLIDAQELADQYGIPRGSIYRLARAGRIPAFRVGVRGGGLRFRASEVLEALRVRSA